MLNTKGAADRLGCSITWIRKLAARKKIQAYVYLDGVLTEHNPKNPHPGLEFFFDEKDLDAYHAPGSGRTMGAKDKPGGKRPPKKKTPKVTLTLTDAEARLLVDLAEQARQSNDLAGSLADKIKKQTEKI